MTNSKMRQSVADRVHGARCGSDCACLANTFHAHGIHRRRRDGTAQSELRQTVSFRKSVVHQRAGEELAVVVVDQFFPHGLAQTLSNTSVNLSIDQHGIDYVAAIVHGDVLVNLDFTGFGVHFHGANVTSEWECKIRGLKEVGGFHAGLESWRNVASGISREDEVAE